VKNVEDIYRLSPLQEGLLVKALSTAGSGVGFEQSAYVLRGAFDSAAFVRAWELVLARHPVLRTAFYAAEIDRPVQVVRRHLDLPFRCEDWQQVPAAEQLPRFDAFLEADRARGFDPSRAPLLRLALFTLAGDVRLFAWSFHHLLLDGWSRILVLEEVMALYELLSAGREPAPPRAAPSFRDYIAWLERQDAAGAATFWRRTLGGLTAASRLLVERLTLGGGGAGGDGDRVVADAVAGRPWEELRALARQGQLTASSLVQGAWALLLSRLGGRREVVFGTVVSGRPAELAGIERTVGMFANNLPVRVAAPPAAPALAWLRSFQDRLAELRQYEHCSPRQIQESSGLPAGARLFESLVVFQNYPGDPLPEGASRRVAVESYRSRFETGYLLTLVGSSGSQLSLSLYAKGERFEAAIVERLLGHLLALLAGLAASPGAPLAELPLLRAAERQEIALECGDAASAVADRRLHCLAEERARSAPDATAAIHGRRRMSYGELDARAELLAGSLSALGLRWGDVVGVLVGPGLDLMVAVLGVLKAGAAFVWLPGGLAAPEPAAILGEVPLAALVVSQGAAAPPWAAGRAVAALGADAGEPGGAARSAEMERSAEVPPESTAWLLASARPVEGRPAPVGIPHALLAGRLLAVAGRLGLGSGDLILAAGPPGSPLYLAGLLLALAAGAGALLVDEAPAGGEPRAAIGAGARFVLGGPGVWSELLARGFPASAELAGIAAGDTLPRGLANRMAAACGTAWVGYGTRETGLLCALGQVSAGEGPVSLGIALPGCHLVLLDRELEPVPPGVPGEICIGGRDTAAASYPRRPRLTAARFVPDRFSGRPGGRLFRTGDLARRLPGEVLEFLGTIDDGTEAAGGDGIPAGEVEALLARLPGVQGAVLGQWTAGAGDPTPVAFLAMGGERSPGAVAIRRMLGQVLPAQRIPPDFVVLETLPRTAAGKVDRAALSASTGQGALVVRGLAPPRDPVELGLVRIWEDVLGVRPLSVRDDFFAVGGNSLAAVQVISRVKEQFGAELPLAALLGSPTVAELADALRRQAPPAPGVLVPIQPHGDLPALFCVHGLGGEVLSYYHLARCLGPRQPLIGIQAPPLPRLKARVEPLADLAARYLEAVREAQPRGPYHLGGYSYGSILAFEMARQLRSRGEAVGLVALLDGPSPLVARTAPERSDAAMLAAMARNLAVQSGCPLALAERDLAGLAERQAIAHILAELKRAALIPMEFELSWVDRMLRGARLRDAALRCYQPSPYDGTLTLFRSTEVELDDSRAWREAGLAVSDRTLGWEALSTRPIEVHLIPGHHATLLDLPNVRILAARLGERLAAAAS
jgi:non-ribosomal peptide synthetase component F/thioesterase domain-containing protein/acyl carrier protein